ncbi:MAG: type III-A CRISPR-associated protein Csm2 [Bacteroidales bacterium]|nr:type III-A CRISPR-associated protein Csm2 [Bacteroidales bacterium]
MQKEQEKKGFNIYEFARRLENNLKNKPLHQVLWLKDFARPQGIAEQIAEKLKREGFKTTQLRKIFSMIKLLGERNKKKITEESKSIIYELYVLMAYANGRENMGKKLLPDDFYTLLKTLLKYVENSNNPKDFEILESFITAIVAYSKYVEKRRNK